VIWGREFSGVLMARTISTDGRVGRAHRISRAATFDSRHRLAVSAEGDALIGWSDETASSLMVRRLSRRSRLGRGWRIARGHDGFWFGLGRAANGNGLIGWLGERDELRLRALAPNGRPDRMKRLPGEISSLAVSPRLLVGNDGRATAVWAAFPPQRSAANPSNEQIMVAQGALD
jgi:hypothetical protein